MIVTILGVDHECQRNDPTGKFWNLLCRQIDKAPVGLLAEEAVENDITVGKRIAWERSIRWLGIDATNEDKVRLRILDELMGRPMTLIFEGDMCVGQKGRYLPRADGIREDLWRSRVISEKAAGALIICGLLHLQSLADGLAARDCEVTQINVCATEWYKEHYGETRLFNDCEGNLWYEHRYKNPLPIFPR